MPALKVNIIKIGMVKDVGLSKINQNIKTGSIPLMRWLYIVRCLFAVTLNDGIHTLRIQ